MVDDPTARMGGTLDIEMRFKIKPKSAGVKEKAMEMSGFCFDRY